MPTESETAADVERIARDYFARVSAREVAERLGVTVLDPALLSVRTAEMLVEALAGQRQAAAAV